MEQAARHEAAELYLEALTDYVEVLQIDPENKTALESLLRVQRVLYQQYSAEIEREPENALLYTQRGLFSLSMGNHAEAVNDLSRAVELKPQNPYYYGNRGIALSEAGEDASAIVDFTAALEIDADLTPYRVSRAVALMDLGNFEEALSELNYTLEVEPDNYYYAMLKNTAEVGLARNLI